ncbi:hypothetical protein GCM10010404_61350 [Nonomuraea africana]
MLAVTDLPRVWHDGRRRSLLAWERRADGWWAHLRHVELTPQPRSIDEVYTPVEDWQPASAVQKIEGEDYSHVARKLAAD